MADEFDDPTGMKVEIWHIDQLIPYDRNPRKITPSAIEKVARSIKKFGFNSPIIVDEDGVILAGHTRREALIQLKAEDVAVIVKHGLTEQEKRAYRIADNRVAEESEWDEDLLKLEMIDLQDFGDVDLADLGFDGAELNKLLRLEDASVGGSEPAKTAAKTAKGDPDAFSIEPSGVFAADGENWRTRGAKWREYFGAGDGSSIVDPVLAELAIRWFCPAQGVVIDPIAGDYVCGIVASKLGRAYHGVMMSAEAHNEAVARLDLAENPAPTWHRGDPRDMGVLIPSGILADLLFLSSPLPFVTDDDVETWNRGMNGVIATASGRLKAGGYAFFAVGDVRDVDDGALIEAPWRINAIARAYGLQLQNSGFYLPEARSAASDFASNRRFSAVPTSIFVFSKGPPTRIAGPVEHG